MNNTEFSNICLTNLLEKDATTFLQYIQDPVNQQHVQRWFNGESKTHRLLFPTTHLLLMLTGKLAPNTSDGFYGSDLPEGIPESLPSKFSRSSPGFLWTPVTRTTTRKTFSPLSARVRILTHTGLTTKPS